MVIGAFPVAKLSVLLIKQISKPIANICKERAKRHPFFRVYVCMPPASFYNWCEVKLKLWILNMGKPVNIPVLSQDMAIELGANLLGEGVIFTIGAALLIFEYNRQSNKEAAKEEKRAQEMGHVNDTIRDLYFTVQKQETQLREMERLVNSLSSGSPLKIPQMGGSEDASKGPSRNGEPGSGSVGPSANPDRASTIKPQACQHIYTNYNQFPTPYPNRGIILQALNYVQMDILQTFSTEVAQEPEKNMSDHAHQGHPGMITIALDNIENELKSLF